MTLWRFVSLPDLSQHRLRALFPLVGIALGVAVFIAVRVTNISTLGAFARTVDAIAGGLAWKLLDVEPRWTKRCCRWPGGCRAWQLWLP